MNKAVKVIAIFLVATIVIIGGYNLLMPRLADISIGVLRGTSTTGKYMESVMLVYAFAPQRYQDEMDDFSTTCGDFHVAFMEEHKDDNYNIKADVKIENKQTIVTYTGTITDGETGIEEPFEKKFIFDYVFTEDVG